LSHTHVSPHNNNHSDKLADHLLLPEQFIYT
jgi:hypothetical protein